MFPQQQQNPFPTNSPSIGATLTANTKPFNPAQQANPLGATAQQGINFNAINIQPPTGIKITTPTSVKSSVLANPVTSNTVQQVQQQYQLAKEHDQQQPQYNATATLPTTSTLPPAGTANGALTPSAPENPYAKYAQQLAQAQEYSPEYLSALKNKQAADTQAASLKSNFYTGNNLPGDTLGYAQGFTTREGALNDISGLRAEQAMQVQGLIRSGNIDAAKSLMGAYAPQTVAPGSSLVSPVTGQEQYSGLGGYQAVQGIQTVNNLAQTYPDARILPGDSLQVAQQKAEGSPSFQSRSTIPVTLPGGGYALVNKNQVAGYRSDGTAIIVSPAQAAQALAAQATITDLTKKKNDVASAIGTVDNNFPILTDIVKKYNLNSGVPLYNQFINLADKNLGQTGQFQLQNIVSGLKASIAQIVGAGGSVDDKVRKEADGMLPNNVSFKVLNDIYGVIKREGQGRISAFDTQLTQQNDALNSIYNTNTPSQTGGTKSSNPASVGWF